MNKDIFLIIKKNISLSYHQGGYVITDRMMIEMKATQRNKVWLEYREDQPELKEIWIKIKYLIVLEEEVIWKDKIIRGLAAQEDRKIWIIKAKARKDS